MKKYILYIVAIMLVVCLAALPCAATEISSEVVVDTTEETVTETVVETSGQVGAETSEMGTEMILDSEAASEIIDVLENADSKAQAILSIAERLGISAEEAEAIVNSIIDVGDKYLGQSQWWIGFKKDIQDNMSFWVTVIVCIVAVLAIVGGAFILLAKTNPTMNKAMLGMDEFLKNAQKSEQANSQTLGEMRQIVADAAAKEEIYEKIISEKENALLALSEQIKALESSAEKERKNMLLAESYNLQILKLICSRTSLPLADKAAIDLWYSRAMESLKSEMSAEDIKKIENVAVTLENVGEQNG